MAERDKRLRYYNGQFLQEQDFTDEQQYHLDRQRRHNRLLHSYGIADGLAVTAEAGSTSVAVHPGTAIDKDGRTIVLTEVRSVEFEAADSKPLLVVIAYSEEPSDPARVGDAGNTRWFERPEVQVIPETEALEEDIQIRLARLHLDKNGAVTQHDKTVRRSAGKLGAGTLEVQNPLGDEAQFIQDQNGNESSLAIGAGKVGIGTNDLKHVLTVAGNVSSGPMVEARSQGNEASVRYVNNNGGVWHAGVGPRNNFFFWSEETGEGALFTPEGVLNAQGVKLSSQGVAADVTGDLSVTGKVLVSGTVDGRDISADGTTLDTLASSTIDGVRLGGNINLVGQFGIAVTGNDAAKEITIANAPGTLAVQDRIGDDARTVRDQAGTPSSLKIGRNTVEIATEVERHVVLKVTGKTTNGPVEELHSTGNESSIRYSVGGGGVPWHVGTGGLAGAGNFFFWNTNGSVATIEPDGTMTTQGSLNVGSGTKDKVVLTVEGDRPAPLVEVNNKQAEALIRFLNSDNEAWHIGTGGLGGAKNFALWNQTNGIVVTIMPDGSMVPRGTMYVGGGTKGKIVLTAESDNPGPTVEVRNKQEEATIRYMDKNNEPWHVGTGGLGGAKNFFFWNQTNGAVAKIVPDGTLSLNGGLEVKKTKQPAASHNGLRSLMIDPATGQVYNTDSPQRAVIRESFTQADLTDTIKLVKAGFQPKLISMEGRAMATLGGRFYGGAVGGFCRCFDDKGFYATGHGPHVVLFAEPPYLNFFNDTIEHRLARVSFHDSSKNIQVYLELIVENITDTGFNLKLLRVTNPGKTPPTEFTVDLAFSILG